MCFYVFAHVCVCCMFGVCSRAFCYVVCVLCVFECGVCVCAFLFWVFVCVCAIVVGVLYVWLRLSVRVMRFECLCVWVVVVEVSVCLYVRFYKWHCDSLFGDCLFGWACLYVTCLYLCVCVLLYVWMYLCLCVCTSVWCSRVCVCSRAFVFCGFLNIVIIE